MSDMLASFFVSASLISLLIWNFHVGVVFTAANNATCNLPAFIQGIDGVSIHVIEFNVLFCDISFIGDKNINAFFIYSFLDFCHFWAR